MPRAVAINVGANGSLPGFRGPIYPDGSAVYVPIPERKPIAAEATVPTYADLDLPIEIPTEHRETDLHLDPSFAEYSHCDDYTYGDEHGVKAAPLLDLAADDLVLFYATLRTVDHGTGSVEPPGALPDAVAAAEPDSPEMEPHGAETDPHGADASPPAPAAPPDWRPPEWGAFVIGTFRLDRDPIPGERYDDLPATDRDRLAENAHVKRETVDAAVFLLGDPERSGLLDPAIPLSDPGGGAAANPIVTELSADSGAGPWWRRPLRFDADATAALARAIEHAL